jgi:hypothetical protein
MSAPPVKASGQTPSTSPLSRLKPDLKIPPLSRRDRRELHSRGFNSRDVSLQARLLLYPPLPPDILRPCCLGDGIEKLSLVRRKALLRLTVPALRTGRFSRFIPASGAASRLFIDLSQLHLHWKSTGKKLNSLLRSSRHSFVRPSVLFFSNLRRLALFVSLQKYLSIRTLDAFKDVSVILEALFDPLGLDVSRRPKALIPFHRKGHEVLTAFDEHLSESALSGVTSVHFTVSPEFLAEFRRQGKKWTTFYARRTGGRFRLTFSVQTPSTDTLALEKENQWVHRADGSLLLRPGGHGALLGNLEATGGDIVLIKNIDNVPVDSLQSEGNQWRMALAGRLIEAQTEAAACIRAIRGNSESEGAILGAEEFIQNTLGIGNCGGPLPKRRTRALSLLSRPWRVCGMVPNAGEPGGGPFWVNTQEGPRRQILEASQLGKSQKKLLARSTHFNPVDMVVGLKDEKGRSHVLSRFADPAQAIVSTKHFEGRDIRTLEHPGLWNGAMAHWNTIFVEVPAAIFHPVKTITDLLRSGHGGRG